MKPIHFLAPALALAGSAYWLNARQDTIRELTEKTRVIRERVVVFEKATAEASTSPFSKSGTEKRDEFTLADGSLDWKKIAELMAESRGNNGMPTNIKSMLKLQQKLMEMEEADLVDGLQKIASLDLEPEVVAMIRSGLLQQLSQKNPLAALEALGDPVNKSNDRSGLSWMQNNLLAQVAKDDPAAAIAWLDRMIADDKLQSTSLDKHNDTRLQLETALINQLVTSDYETAKARLAAFSDEEKSFLLSNNHHQFGTDDPSNYLKLVRESLPPEEASKAITRTLGSQYHSELSSISESLKDAQLSESEKNDVLERLVGNYSRNKNSENKYEEIYEWSKTEAPGQEVALVTKALVDGGNRWNDPQSGFEEALAVAESMQEPKILTDYVADFSNNGNEHTVEHQLKKFKDPAVAEQYQAIVDTLPETESESPPEVLTTPAEIIESIELEVE